MYVVCLHCNEMKMKRGLLKIYYLIYYISSVHIILRDKPAGAQDDCIVFIRLLFFLLLLIVCTPFSFHLPFFFFFKKTPSCRVYCFHRTDRHFHFIFSFLPSLSLFSFSLSLYLHHYHNF